MHLICLHQTLHCTVLASRRFRKVSEAWERVKWHRHNLGLRRSRVLSVWEPRQLAKTQHTQINLLSQLRTHSFSLFCPKWNNSEVSPMQQMSRRSVSVLLWRLNCVWYWVCTFTFSTNGFIHVSLVIIWTVHNSFKSLWPFYLELNA